VPTERRDEPFVGVWDLKELLAHLVGWDRTNLDALHDFLAGRRPAFYDRYDPGWSAYNAELVARYRIDDFDALLDSLVVSQRNVIEGLRVLSAADLTRERAIGRSGRPLTIAGLLRAAIYDEQEHLRQIEASSRQRMKSG
jgi:DinB superfamily